MFCNSVSVILESVYNIPWVEFIIYKYTKNLTYGLEYDILYYRGTQTTDGSISSMFCNGVSAILGSVYGTIFVRGSIGKRRKKLW